MKFKKEWVTFLFAVVLVFSISNVAWAQTMEIAKTKSYGGRGTDQIGSLQPTSDGGYIACGFTNSTDGDFPVSGKDRKEDGVVVKYKSDLSVEWTKVLGGTNSDWLNQVRQTSDGGYIVCGFSNSADGIFATIPIFENSPKTINKGSMDGVLIKLKSDGSVEWAETVGGSKYDDITCVEQTPDGGYIVVGETSSKDDDMQGFPADSTYFDTFIGKFSSDGTRQWMKTAGMGELNCVRKINGGYITCGFLDSPYFANNTQYQHPQSCVICWNSDGSVRWKKVFSGSGEDTGFSSVCQTSDGGFAAAGASCSNDKDYQGLNKGGDDIFLAKFHSDGGLEWTRDIGGSLNEQVCGIYQAKDNGYVVVGGSLSDDKDFIGQNSSNQTNGFVLKLKGDGSTDWLKDYKVSMTSIFNSIVPTSDGGYLVNGISSDNANFVNGNIDSFISKINNFQTVDFETNGGTTVNPVKQIENTTAGSFPSTLKAGYTFAGWYSDPALTKTSKVSFPYTFDAPRKMYAKWVNHTITYDYGHDGLKTTESTLTGSLLNGTDTPARGGYQFGGWYREADCRNKWNFSTDKVGNSDFTLYAKWMPDQYKVNWRYLGETHTSTFSAGDLLNQTETYPEKDGYSFEGWYYDAAYTNRVAFPLYMPANDLDIYGKYTPKQPEAQCTVTYDSQGGSTVEGLKANKGSLLTAPAVPKKDGCAFCGWYKDNAGTDSGKWDFAADRVTSDLTLYAYWLLMGDVNFDGSVDTFDANMVMKYYAGQITLSEKQRLVADMDSDGEIGSFDAGKINKIYSSKYQ